MDYGAHFSKRATAQKEAIPGEQMVQNNAGGFTFEVDIWTRLERFLILGTEGGSYYVGEHTLTVENAQNVVTCIQTDGNRVLDIVLEISKEGRAPKNDPALFVLAMVTGMGNEAERKRAFAILPQVARIGTHLLHFAKYMEDFRGWGRAARRGVGNWFLNQSADQLGYQFLKYAQRDGWALRDLLRLSHPITQDNSKNALFKYMVSGEFPEGENILPLQVQVAASLNEDSSVQEVVQTVQKSRLPREAIPNNFLQFPEVWEALLESMPMMALVRNLGKMTQVGLLKPLSGAANQVVEKLTDPVALQKSRIHPINLLAAQVTYAQGHGFKGNLAWAPVQQVIDALDQAFYDSFKFVEPTNKRTLIGLDVSGSMNANIVNGMPFLKAREASAAMALVTARTERNHHFMGFTGEFIPLNISPRMRLDSVIKSISGLKFGRTDCALPMLWALENKVEVDTFIIYTDNETWYGKIHPIQALRKYREVTGIPAKLITCALTATKFSIGKSGSGRILTGDPGCIADPNDKGMLDVAGLDSAAPQLIANFSRE